MKPKSSYILILSIMILSLLVPVANADNQCSTSSRPSYTGCTVVSGFIPRLDSDCDCTVDSWDNCMQIWNPNQEDANNDGVGDACTQAVPPSSPCAEPTGLSPSSRITISGDTGTADLSWNAVAQAIHYNVRLDDGTGDRYNDPRFITCPSSLHYYCENEITSTRITNIPVKAGRTYNFWVDPVYSPEREYCSGSTQFSVERIAPSNNPPSIVSCSYESSIVSQWQRAVARYSVSDQEGDSYNVKVNWGDGEESKEAGTASEWHIYKIPGTYSATITATDSRGASSSRNCGALTVISANNNPPVINSCSSPGTVTIGALATIPYSVSDREGHSVTTVVNWGDGTSSAGDSSSASHTYAALGTYSITVTATDSFGASSSRSCSSITVVSAPVNNPPIINSCSIPGTVSVGTTATIGYSTNDLEGDSYSVSVNWGDGTSSAGGASSASHAYSSIGTYSITITATDSRGASSSRSCGTITVISIPNNPPAIASCSNSGSATLGAVSSATYSISDLQGNTFTTSINWGDGTSSAGGASSASRTYPAAGTYSIILTATDSLGASASLSCGSLTISPVGAPPPVPPPGPAPAPAPSSSGSSSCGYLDISKVRAKVDSKSDSNVGDGDEISPKAKPGSSVEIKVEVENTFNSSGPDIEDITVTATLEGVGDGDDLDDESNEFDLNPGDDKKLTFRFEVPDNAEDGSYDITIEAEGEDENSNDHDCDYDIELEVEREEHALDITGLSVKPNAGNCTMGAAAQIRISNTGQNDETAAVEVTGQFGYSQRFDNIYISSEQDSSVYSSALKLAFPRELDEGQNILTFNVYGSNNDLLDSQTAEATGAFCLRSSTFGSRTPVLSGKQKIQGKESTLILTPQKSKAGNISLSGIFEENALWKKIMFYIIMFIFMLMLIIILLLGIKSAVS